MKEARSIITGVDGVSIGKSNVDDAGYLYILRRCNVVEALQRRQDVYIMTSLLTISGLYLIVLFARTPNQACGYEIKRS